MMGLFNIYGTTQLKAGEDLSLKQFSIGDKVPLNDGVYVGENVVVIIDAVFVAEFPNLHSYHGYLITAKEVSTFINSNCFYND